MQQASYLTSLQIAIIGGAPLFWKPLSSRYGRRPIFLLSVICSLVCNVGCAKSRSYAAMAACRALVAFFICPPSAMGSAIVTETFFRRDWAKCMGVWTIMVTLGVPTGPLIFGFVTYRVDYQWIYWTLAIVGAIAAPTRRSLTFFFFFFLLRKQVNGVQLILYLFGAPETLRSGEENEYRGSAWKTEYLSLRRIDRTPFSLYEFVQPFIMVVRPTVFIPTAAYAMCFLFCSILTSVEMPQILQEKFDLNAQQLGLQFLGLIIGTLLGEQLGGISSDVWMNRRERAIGRKPEPEFRLWLSYIGFVLGIVGIIIYLVCAQNAKIGHWTVSPVIGTAFAAFGNQVITTVLVTYAVDCYPKESASVGVFITFVRQIWGFIGPFWYVFGSLIFFPFISFWSLLTRVGFHPCLKMLESLVALVSVLRSLWLSVWFQPSWPNGKGNHCAPKEKSNSFNEKREAKKKKKKKKNTFRSIIVSYCRCLMQ